MKRFLAITLNLILFVLGLTSCSSIISAKSLTLKIGDYVQMGKYFDEPILWRCVDIDENGPLMLSDKIITIKAFDAKGNHTYADGTAQADVADNPRTHFGSNLWETSNIRSWLNSSATAGNVVWPDGCPPTKDNIFFERSAYDSEKGFLAEGNFTSTEQNTIKSVTQKSLLNKLDVPKLSIGGTAVHSLGLDITDAVKNYDTAYYHNVTDKIFLLDVKQLNRVYQNKTILGTNYYIGKPTQKTIDNYHYRYDEDIMLRSPDVSSTDTDSVRRVKTTLGGYNTAYDAFLGQLGEYLLIPSETEVVYSFSAYSDFAVRPAFYIDLSTANFKSGSGSANSPYVVSADTTGEETFKLVQATTQPSKSSVTPLTLYTVAGVLAAMLISGEIILSNSRKKRQDKDRSVDVKTDASYEKVPEAQGRASHMRFYQNTMNIEHRQSHKWAVGMVYFIGGLNLIVGLALAYFKVDTEALKLNIPLTITYGLIFLVLGFFVQKKSNSALVLAIVVFWWDALRMIVSLLIDHSLDPIITGWLIGHIFFTIPMLGGISAIHHLKKEIYYRKPISASADNQLVGCIVYIVSSLFLLSIIVVGFLAGLKEALVEIGAFFAVVIVAALFLTFKNKRLGLDNISIALVHSSNKIEGEEKTYEIELSFDNKNSDDKKVSIGQLLRYIGLTAHNQKKRGYCTIYDKACEFAYLPQGKTNATFEIIVNKNVVLQCLYIKYKAAMVIPDNGGPSEQDGIMLNQIEAEKRKRRDGALAISGFLFILPFIILIIIAILIIYVVIRQVIGAVV